MKRLKKMALKSEELFNIINNMTKQYEGYTVHESVRLGENESIIFIFKDNVKYEQTFNFNYDIYNNEIIEINEYNDLFDFGPRKIQYDDVVKLAKEFIDGLEKLDEN